ncbi:MAG TPA: hypothetical protein V6D33_11680 [Cyanophyceae cyanobacterium]
MADFTFSAEDLRQKAAEALVDGDFEGAIALADNAKDTEEATDNEQKQGQESGKKGSAAD